MANIDTMNRAETGQEIKERVAAYLDVVREQAAAGEEAGRLTDETVCVLDQAGAYGIGMPIEYGGTALGARDMLDILTEIGKADAAAGWSVAIATSQWFIFAFPDQAVAELLDGPWVGPRLAGATFASFAKAKARRVDGGFMAKGEWSFGSNVQHSRFFAAGVTYEDESGEPRRGQMLLERSQYRIKDDWHVMGLAATGSNSVVVADEVFVPAHRIIPIERQAALMMGDMGDRFEGLFWRINRPAALGICNAGVAIGLALGALEAFIAQAKIRVPFRVPYPTMAEMPSAQIVAGKARAMISAAEAMSKRAADVVDEHGRAARPLLPDLLNEITLEISYAHRLIGEAVDMLQLSVGSTTASLTNPLQRHMRDIRVMNLHGAMRMDINAEHVGRALLGQPPFPIIV